MSEVYEDSPRQNVMGRVWSARFATNAGDLNDKVYVIIPDIDGTMRIGPCRWQARDAVSLPARGDSCLVIFDNDREPWVVAWWPF